MSVVVAYHEEGTDDTFVGCDGMASCDGVITSTNATKWFFSQKHPWGIGVVGDIRTLAMVRRYGAEVLDEALDTVTKGRPRKKLTEESRLEVAYLVSDAIREMLLNDQYVVDREECGPVAFLANLMIVCPQSVYRADATFSPTPGAGFSGCYAIGSGMSEATAAMMAVRRLGCLSGGEICLEGIGIAAQLVTSVGGDSFLWGLSNNGVVRLL